MEPFDTAPEGLPPGVFRYTNLASLLHILQTRTVTLLNCGLWDDLNDRHYVDFYREKKALKSVLALCFTTSSETYHHWRVFSPGMDGVRIHFKLPALVENMRGHPQFQMRWVAYSTIEDARQQAPELDAVPFFKRFPYRDEKEFRLLWCDDLEVVASKQFEIQLSAIDRITLSPWLPPALADSVKRTIKGVEGCSAVPVFASTVRDNKDWRHITKMMTGAANYEA